MNYIKMYWIYLFTTLQSWTNASNVKILSKRLLPPAYVVWQEVMFSLCPPLGGWGGVTPSPSHNTSTGPMSFLGGTPMTGPRSLTGRGSTRILARTEWHQPPPQPGEDWEPPGQVCDTPLDCFDRLLLDRLWTWAVRFYAETRRRTVLRLTVDELLVNFLQKINC